MPTLYYKNCRCPKCRAKLDEVAESFEACPSCNHPLLREEVWATRSYTGMVILPRWVSAFGWPFLLIVAGFACIAIPYVTGIPVPMKLPALLIAFGMVYFIVKLSGADN